MRRFAALNTEKFALIFTIVYSDLCLDELLPVTTKIVNLSLESDVFSGDWKNALVHPLLKKAGLQPFNKNLRSVSNLQFTSKITEKRSVALQMQDHMVANRLFPDLQCVYWPNHSAETARLRWLRLILWVTVYFYTGYSPSLVCGVRLYSGSKILFGWKNAGGSVNVTRFKKFNVNCGVPQGWYLGPLLFTIYASTLFDILESHLPSVHIYADDTELLCIV